MIKALKKLFQKKDAKEKMHIKEHGMVVLKKGDKKCEVH